MEDNYFLKLYGVNVSDKIEKKNGLSYVSWCYVWAEVKKQFPEANYTIYENKDGWFYHTDGKTAWVKTGLTINGIEHIEMLPVMDYKNRSIPLEQVTSYDVKKAIQRSLTKAAARHGLGLYIYAGEDLPEAPASEENAPAPEAKKSEPAKKAAGNVQKKPAAEVTTQAKLPEEAAPKAPEKPVELSPQMAYLNNELNFFGQQTGQQFKDVKALFMISKKAAGTDKKIPDKKMGEYTEAELKTVLDLMKKNYGDAA